MLFIVYYCYGTQLSVYASTSADFYGTKNIGFNYGLLLLAWGVAGISGPFLGGRIFVATGAVHRRDEVAVIAFRGPSAEVLLEPTGNVELVRNALEYVPTGGRTPLAHALELATSLLTEDSFLVLVSDGRANVAFQGDDPWKDALEAAAKIDCQALVIETEVRGKRTGKAKEIADTMGADYVRLDVLQADGDLPNHLMRLKRGAIQSTRNSTRS